MNIGGLRLVVLGMVLGSALAAALVFGLQLHTGHQANATQGTGYSAHLSIGGCTANCNVPVPGSNFTVDINLDTWIDPYDSFGIDLISTTGICIGANVAAMSTSWPNHFDDSGCRFSNEADAAGGRSLDPPATQKGKIAEATFQCSQNGVISLEQSSVFISTITGQPEPVTIGDLSVTCATSGPTATPTVTRTPTPTVVFGSEYTGHMAIGSCTANCSVAVGSIFVVSLTIDTLAHPYDAFEIHVIGNTGACNGATANAARVFWPGLVDVSGCLTPTLGSTAAAKGARDEPSTFTGKVGEISFNCSESGTLTVEAGIQATFIVESGGNLSPIAIPPLQVTCKPATPTATPTATPPRPIGGVSIDPALPPGDTAGMRIDVVIAIAAAGAVAMSGVAWYARKRWARRG